MIQGYAIYLRTHRATGKQYGGAVWSTRPNWCSKKACEARWRDEDTTGIRGLFGGFDSQIILSEARADAPEMSDGLYRIRIAVDEAKIVDAIPRELRLNKISPLITGAALTDELRRLGGRIGGPVAGNTAKENKTGIFATDFDRSSGGRIGGRKNAESGHIARIATPDSCRAGGLIAGRAAVESGQIFQIRTKASEAKGGRSASHVRWHIKRNIRNLNCSLCSEK